MLSKCNVSELEIREFANNIGIEIPPYKYHEAHDQYHHEGNVLHELGHWAVFPQLIIDHWLNQKHDKEYPEHDGMGNDVDGSIPGIIPSCSGWIAWYINTQLVETKYIPDQYPSFPHIKWIDDDGKNCVANGNFFLYASLPIPDEWAVQEWCRQVKIKLGWDCFTSYWDTGGTPSERNEQLKRVGIDISNAIYRPTVTRIDFKKWHWRLFNKRKLLCKSPIFYHSEDKQKNIIGFV